MSYRISRRRLFATSGAFLTLPLLEALLPQKARAQAPDPRRLVLIHWPDGTKTRANDALSWFAPPAGPLTAATAPVQLQPFTANLGDMTLLKGLTQSARNATMEAGAGGHGGAKPGFTTGQVPRALSSSVSGIDGDSFDVMYAKQTPQRLGLYLANAEQGSGDGVGYGYELSHKDGQKVVPTLNPVALYDAYFKNLTGGSGPPPPANDYARNPKVLDVPVAATQGLRARLGKADRLRLDAYLSGLADLKASLAAPPPMSTCAKPPAPAVNSSVTNRSGLSGQNFFDRFFAFNSLIAVGFQCDLFRSVVISFGDEAGGLTYDGVYPASLSYQGASLTVQFNHSISHHGTSGGGPSGDFSDAANITRDRVNVHVLVDLIDKLKAVTDPSGSKVLDNTIVMAGFCVDDGQHDTTPTQGSPIIVAGGRNFMSPGQVVNASQWDLNDLYFTFGGLLGMGLPSFHPIAQSVRAWGPKTGRTSGSSVIPL